jgi:hypothetical protein
VATRYVRRLALAACTVLGAAALLPGSAAPATVPILPVLSPLTQLLAPVASQPAATPAPPAPVSTQPNAPAPTAPTAPAGPVSSLTQVLLPTCGSPVHPFAQFGDQNSYYGFANNGFENGLTGWRASGASVVGGNEPWYVNGHGSSSLSLSPNGTAASPLVCINLLDPDWRMFAHANGANGPLHAQIVFYGVTGNLTGVLNVADLQASKYGSWQPTTVIRSLLALPLLTKYAQLQVSSGATRGTWQIDDVFVDPWANRA